MPIVSDINNLGGAISTGSTASFSFNTASSVASGGFIVVGIGWFADSSVITSLSGGGLTWSVDKTDFFGGVGAGMASAQAPVGLAAGTAIQVNWNSSVTIPIIGGTSFTGVKTSSPVDGTPLGITVVNAADWSSGNYLIQAGSVIVGIDWNSGAIASHTPTSCTEAWERIDPTDDYGAVLVWRIESAAGSYPVGGTWNTAGSNGNVAVAYLAAADAATNLVAPFSAKNFPKPQLATTR